jgi:hypothetical protein
VLFFNRRDFFEAHEVWEDIWGEAVGPERRFYQGLIQAAVALYHFGNGNLGGTRKLYRTGRNYMMSCAPRFHGLDVDAFWAQMERCCADALAETPDRSLRPDEALLPTIILDPPPSAWPDPAEFVDEDH